MREMHEPKEMIETECFRISITPDVIHMDLSGVTDAEITNLRLFLAEKGIGSYVEYEGMCG
jgi:hypothetical protein